MKHSRNIHVQLMFVILNYLYNIRIDRTDMFSDINYNAKSSTGIYKIKKKGRKNVETSIHYKQL